ncbi:MAG: sulfatase-like hydrolase/transferase, partial [Holosporales bacterium]|nr:sulfatase-like hydrolase/transferase [Holosporales bacterium]
MYNDSNKQNKSKILRIANNRTLIQSLVIALLLVLPDFVFSCVHKAFKMPHDIKGIVYILPLAFGLVLNKYKWISVIAVVLLCILQIIQFSHIVYFGTVISPYAIYLMLHEMEDVFSETCSIFGDFFWILPIVIIPFFAIFCCLKTTNKKHILGTILLFSMFSFFPMRNTSASLKFAMNEVRFTIYNSIKAFSGFIVLILQDYKLKQYQSYKVIDLKPEISENINIVYIIGESVNYKHMSLFGYERDTTPLLKKLFEQNDNFYFTQGISGAIAT